MTSIGDDTVLVASLLEPPRPVGDLLAERPRLRDLLTRACDAPLVLISAEPAAGKTTLVATWLAQGFARQRPVAWLTVRGLDDEVLFWRYLLAAVDSFDIETGDLRSSLLDNEAPNDRWLTTLANRISQLDGRPLIVIDDLHEVTSPDTLRSLETFLDRLSSTVTCVITTRSMPSWPLSLWRMRGRLREIGSQALRFNEREVDELLDLLGDVELGDDEIALLLRRTEGWAGGIQLALVALRGSDDPSTVLSTFAASDETVSTYLVRDVLERQAPEVRDFLLDISLLDELSVGLCDEVLQRGDSERLVAQCRAEHLFLTDLDGRGDTFRLHQLFRDLLRATLESSDPQRAADIHRRASEVLEQRGDIRRAVAHARANGDGARVGVLVSRHAMQFAQRGQFDEIRNWVGLLAPVNGAGQPASTFGLLMALILAERPDEALGMIARLLETEIAPRFRYGLVQLAAMAYMLAGDFESLGGVAATLAEESPEDDAGLPFGAELYSSFNAGVVAFFRGEVDTAAESIERASRLNVQPNLFSASSPGWYALVAADQGHLGIAEASARESLDRHRRVSSADTAVKVPALLALAKVALARNDPAACQDHLVAARRSVTPLLWETVLVELVESRARCRAGDGKRAIADLSEAARLFLPSGNPSGLHGLVAERLADLCLRVSDLPEAERWCRGFEHTTGRALSPSLRVRLASAQGASDLRSVCEEALGERSAIPERLETLLAVASVQRELGDDARALTLVAEAASIAEAEVFVGPFVDAGPSIATLVRDLLAEPPRAAGAAASPFFLATLETALSATPAARDVVRTADGLVEQLSARELEVLSLLEHEMNYSTIGDRLYVSRNTVKSHVRHVYTKLGVSNRTEAIAEARRLGLL